MGFEENLLTGIEEFPPIALNYEGLVNWYALRTEIVTALERVFRREPN